MTRQDVDVPDDIVERAAIKLYEHRQYPNWRAPNWEEIDPEGQDSFRGQARVVLEDGYHDIRAKALEEAADALNIDGLGFKRGGWGGNPVDMAVVDFALKVMDWLRARAEAERADR